MQEAPQLDAALAIADGAASAREAAVALRAHLPGLRIVVVDAFDMRGETPAARGARRALFYGASDGHCWQVTTDGAAASGLFVADNP